jgi:hypothetical protein
MLNLQQIFNEYSKADAIEKLSVIPCVGSVTNLSFIFLKAVSDLRINNFANKESSILKNHTYFELLITAVPFLGIIYRVNQFVYRSFKADLEIKRQRQEELRQEQAAIELARAETIAREEQSLRKAALRLALPEAPAALGSPQTAAESARAEAASQNGQNAKTAVILEPRVRYFPTRSIAGPVLVSAVTITVIACAIFANFMVASQPESPIQSPNYTPNPFMCPIGVKDIFEKCALLNNSFLN